MSDADYSKLSDEEFDSILAEILSEMSGAQILAVPGAYEVFREEFNNEVLDRWEKRNPGKAFPNEENGDEN